MNNFKAIAKKFQNDHLGKGTISKVTDYSFQYTTLPDKDGKIKTCVYMASYFLEI